ncbi:Uncharacterised protein [Klebsiella pneumoniae]|nr:hypothetical protein L472_005058 [Klebsiella pneumoniae BIDMC 35]SXM97459.1 Uncharacterised protein [Klebsiella pneumoniae]
MLQKFARRTSVIHSCGAVVCKRGQGFHIDTTFIEFGNVYHLSYQAVQIGSGRSSLSNSNKDWF